MFTYRRSIRRCTAACRSTMSARASHLLSSLSSVVTGEIHFVDAGYNIISMPRPEDLRGDDSQDQAAGVTAVTHLGSSRTRAA